MPTPRRAYLRGLVLAGTAGLAGCADGGLAGDDAPATPNRVRPGSAGVEIVDGHVERFEADHPAGPDVLAGNLREGEVRNRTMQDRTFVFVR